MQQAVQLKVNQERLIHNIRFAFTNSTTVLAELMQNARRAGATYIAFRYDADLKTLIVEDDGCGIDNMQNLLTIAESGWDEETQANEHPYGIGFLSTLYSAEHVTIESNRQKLAFDVDKALGFESICIEEGDVAHGSKITLRNVNFKKDIKEALKHYARGFPIKVLFDGEDLPRPDAINGEKYFIETEIGQIHLPGFDNAKHVTYEITVYLQGLPVHGEINFRTVKQVVHLDCKRFSARMPDRDKLIDENQVLDLIFKTIKDLWRVRMGKAKKEMSHEDFADRYSTLMMCDAVDLLNDVPLLPREVLCEISDTPRITEYYEEWQTNCTQHIAMEDILCGKTKVCTLPDLTTEHGPAKYTLAWRSNVLWMKKYLNEDHWIYKHVIDMDSDDFDIAIHVHGEISRDEYFGNDLYFKAPVVICESYSIQGDTQSYRFGKDGLFDDGVFYIPIKMDKEDCTVLRQAVDFADENGNYDENLFYAEADSFSDFLASRINNDPKETLSKLICRALDKPTHKDVLGKSFYVSIGADGNVTVEEIAS